MRGGSVGGSTNDTPTSVSSSSVMGRYRAGGAEDGSSSGGGGGEFLLFFVSGSLVALVCESTETRRKM